MAIEAKMIEHEQLRWTKSSTVAAWLSAICAVGALFFEAGRRSDSVVPQAPVESRPSTTASFSPPVESPAEQPPASVSTGPSASVPAGASQAQATTRSEATENARDVAAEPQARSEGTRLTSRRERTTAIPKRDVIMMSRAAIEAQPAPNAVSPQTNGIPLDFKHVAQ